MADHEELTHKSVDAHRETTTKFSYYLAGVTLGVLAFTLQTYKKPPNASIAYLYISSWAMLLVSFMASIIRLKAMIAAPGLESMRFWNWSRPRTPANSQDIDRCESLVTQEMNDLSARAARWFRVALWSFFLGLLLQAGSKTWEILLDVGANQAGIK